MVYVDDPHHRQRHIFSQITRPVPQLLNCRWDLHIHLLRYVWWSLSHKEHAFLCSPIQDQYLLGFESESYWCSWLPLPKSLCEIVEQDRRQADRKEDLECWKPSFSLLMSSPGRRFTTLFVTILVSLLLRSDAMSSVVNSLSCRGQWCCPANIHSVLMGHHSSSLQRTCNH